ncbi:MAG: 2-amino-4-hydroxy-6-hydroxymethyldihydropteridine diphosphokinase [Pseudomonadales bacterium]|nr:2-amino-4-hydroxy-6-hydroxymethyldihydropteridine diphosphokinase [Pseudomonadales bacterium]
MVLVGLGSNQGESTDIVVAAIHALESYAMANSLRCSELFRTSPVNCPPGSGNFVNAAVVFEAVEGLSPETLLRELKRIERDFGRAEKYERNAPRELDLDLLLFDQQTRESEEFTLPHPRAVDRLFVLKPAAQLIPDAIWPGLDKSIARLLDELETDEQVYALEERPPFCVAVA